MPVKRSQKYIETRHAEVLNMVWTGAYVQGPHQVEMVDRDGNTLWMDVRVGLRPFRGKPVPGNMCKPIHELKVKWYALGDGNFTYGKILAHRFVRWMRADAYSECEQGKRLAPL